MSKRSKNHYIQKIRRTAEGAAGYLWNNTDLHYAMKWLQLPSQSSMDKGPSNESVKELLTSLVRSPAPSQRNLHAMEEGDSFLKHIILHSIRLENSRLSSSKPIPTSPLHSSTFLLDELSHTCSMRHLTLQLHDKFPSFLNNLSKHEAKDDNYFLQQETIVQLAYAGQIYQRLLELHELDEKNQQQPVTRNNEYTSQVESFLHKLCSLSMLKQTVHEVFALLLLEPYRETKQKDQKSTTHMKEVLSRSFLSSINVSTFSSSQKMVNQQQCLRWRLPSPILCALSVHYFPIARCYLSFLLDITINKYCKEAESTICMPKDTHEHEVHYNTLSKCLVRIIDMISFHQDIMTLWGHVMEAKYFTIQNDSSSCISSVEKWRYTNALKEISSRLHKILISDNAGQVDR